MFRFFTIICVFLCHALHAKQYTPKFDGILGQPIEAISNCTGLVAYFLPYNPTVLEIGAYEGSNSVNLAAKFPKGQVIVFEPNPRAFEALIARTQNYPNVSAFNLAMRSQSGVGQLHICHGVYCDNPQLEHMSSLLDEYPGRSPYFKGPVIDVACVNLDEWCKSNGISSVDFIQIDVEGMELDILQSSPTILNTVKVISTKTNGATFRKGTVQFAVLKKFLEKAGFEMLAHWYREGLQGEATFIRKYVYDAMFR